jgi:hypothetical protein
LHLDEVFADPHVQSREMEIKMNFPGFDQSTSLIGSPMKFSRTKVDYRLPPPRIGEHTEQVLTEAGYSEADVAELTAQGAIDTPKFAAKGPRKPTLRKMRKLAQESGPAYAFKGNTWGDLASVSVPLDQRSADAKELSDQDVLDLVLRNTGENPADTLRALTDDPDLDSKKPSQSPNQIPSSGSSTPTNPRAD